VLHQSQKLLARTPRDGLGASCATCPIRDLTTYKALARDQPLIVEQTRIRQTTRYRGQLVLAQGEQAGSIFTIRKGWATRYVMLRNGRRQILSFLLPGDTIGLEFLTTSTASASVRALTDMSLCEFEPQSLMATAMTTRTSSIELITSWARQNATAETVIISLGRLSAIERMAHLIYRFQSNLAGNTRAGPESFSVPLRRDDFADALGLTPVHVSRTFATLKTQGILGFKSGIATILDQTRLRELAERGAGSI
jgi:CRP-like cAMP-binding protein